ncbi:hypothetical protein LCGC14_2274140 [marine sediment metagenome]|uniref:Uncharacterized protein n=1 Tax=marine sediment metagenome TaxID=412755 RepID=A0A0F9DIB7_9ZZZZ
MKILECEYCKKAVQKAITYDGTHIYHPNCYVLKDKETYPILFSSRWKKIHAIKFTANKKEHKKTDILLESKNGRIFIIYNWKRVYRKEGKKCHSWYYEVYEGKELIIDGQYETDDYRYAQQSDMLKQIFIYLELEVLKLRKSKNSFKYTI